MKALTAFYTYVEPHCPGVTIPMMQQALRTAAYEFCEKSLLLQQTFSTNLKTGDKTIDIELPSQQQFVRLLRAQYKDVWVPIGTSESAFTNYNGTAGPPQAVWLESPSDGPVVVFPTPDKDETAVLFLTAAFAPIRTATQFEDVLFDDWVDVIAAGAIALLQSMPGATFFSPTAATYRLAFEQGMARAKRVATAGRTQSSLRAKPRSFA